MPTIEIDIPEGRPAEFIERAVRERDVSYLEVLLHGADALATPDTEGRESTATAMADHDCEWGECEDAADLSVTLHSDADGPRYYCSDCFARFAAHRRMNGHE